MVEALILTHRELLEMQKKKLWLCKYQDFLNGSKKEIWHKITIFFLRRAKLKRPKWQEANTIKDNTHSQCTKFPKHFHMLFLMKTLTI